MVFHSLKGTGKSIGFDKVTDIAADALATTQRAINNEISLKLYKAKVEANLCEIEEILPPQDLAEVSFTEVDAGQISGIVLVVDDDISLVRAIKERLIIDGYKVVEASSFDEATSYLKQKLPIDLMIIDIIMPGESGFELCHWIKHEKYYEDTPIIFLTAETSLDIKLRGFDIGADDYVIKPISLDEIAAKVRATINRTRKFKNKLLYDELTGAYNRSFLEAKFYEEMARSQRNGKPFGLCLCDMDYFKNINDTYGHQAGDKVLVEFVKSLKLQTRTSDAVIRFGGEEFILVLSQADEDKICEILNRLKAVFAKKLFKINKNTFTVTFSAGIAVYPKDGSSLDILLSSADKALYNAKRSGRNKICQISI